jgi:hypothetical protein
MKPKRDRKLLIADIREAIAAIRTRARKTLKYRGKR